MKEPLLSISEEKLMQRFVDFFKRHHKLVKNFAIIDTFWKSKNFHYIFEDSALVFTFIDGLKNAKITFVKGSHVECYDNTPCVFFSRENTRSILSIIEKPSNNTSKPNKS